MCQMERNGESAKMVSFLKAQYFAESFDGARIIPEFRILRLTFHRKSVSLKMLN